MLALDSTATLKALRLCRAVIQWVKEASRGLDPDDSLIDRCAIHSCRRPRWCFGVDEEERHVARTHLLTECLSRLCFGDHVAEDAEHRKSAVGHLSVQLLCLLLLRILHTEETHIVISIVLGRGPPCHLDEAAKEENLSHTRCRDAEDALTAIRDVRELQLLRERKVPWELDISIVE